MKLRYLLFLSLFPLLGFICKETFTGKREARGVWMSRFEYANERTRENPELAKQRIREVFEKARKARFNMILFQVRGNADAFYKSSFEPWGEMLSGMLGQDPGWDPLQFAIEEAHRLGLELHAWMNTFPVWRGPNSPGETKPRAILLEHPEWLVCDKDGVPMRVDPPNNDYLWASPGIPAVRNHVLNVVKEIVSNYDVDGVHFDYIRYPEGSSTKGYSHDSVSVARFNSTESNPYRLSWEHWQRDQVNQFVFDAYHAVNEMKPWVKMSASVIGKYMGPGWSSYYIVYQDPRRWMELGKIDFIVPMVYWERTHPTHPFVPLITQWHDRVAYDRLIVPGLSAGLQRKYGWDELSEEIEEVRELGLPGVVFFSAAGLDRSWDIVGEDEFPYWSLVPAMPWKDDVPPLPPLNLTVDLDTTGVVLLWEAPSGDEPLSYVVYRSTTGDIARDEVKFIVGITGRNITRWLDEHPIDDEAYYSVSAVDRLGNESVLSTIVSLQAKLAARIDSPR